MTYDATSIVVLDKTTKARVPEVLITDTRLGVFTKLLLTLSGMPHIWH